MVGVAVGVGAVVVAVAVAVGVAVVKGKIMLKQHHQTVLHQVVASSHKLGPTTREMYLGDLDRWVAFAGSNPTSWTRRRAQDFYDHLLTTRKPRSANRVMAALQYASKRRAVLDGEPDFAIYERAADHSQVARRSLTTDEAARLLATVSGDDPLSLRDHALIVTGLETGMRKMSLAAIMLDTVKMGRDGYPVAPVPIKGRGDVLYEVPLSNATMIAVEPWRQWLRSHKVTRGPMFRSLRRHLDKRGHATYTPGDKLSLSGIYKIVEKRAAEAGLPDVHPHIFRHTFITWRFAAGLSPMQVATITGHKMSGVAGLGGMASYVDASRIAVDARESTPAWLARLVGRRS